MICWRKIVENKLSPTYARQMMTLKFETCKAILEDNHDQALTTISDPIAMGEK